MIAPLPAGALTVGGASVGVEPVGAVPPWSPDPMHAAFVGDGGSPRLPLRLVLGGRPQPGWRRLEFLGDRLWAIHATGDGFLLGIKGPSARATPSRVLRVDHDWRAGELWVRVDARHSGAGRDPLEFPLAPVLFPGLLAHHGGALVHAAAAIVDGRGLVLAGRSGAGKTTLARLCREAGWPVLNDERVVVRCDTGDVRVYGTPWAGELGIASPRSAPVAAVCLLEHAPSPRAVPLPPALAARLLLPRCRLPFWDARAMAGLLACIERIVTSVPTFRLGFAPERATLDLLARLDTAAAPAWAALQAAALRA